MMTIPIWKQNILDLNKTTDVDSISETIDSVFDTFEKEGYLGIDLCFVKSDGVNTEHLAGVLRATSSVNGNIQGWKHALSICYVSAQKNGYDPDDVLFGLT